MLDVRVGRARLAGVRAGAGGTPQLILLHAGIADHRSWLDLVDLLAPRMDVVAYDQRGFGATTYVPEGHDPVDDLMALLDQCGFEQAVLIGNSRGGQIALDFALVHPETVAALVLLAPAVSGAPRATPSDLRPDESAFWESLETAEAAGDLEMLNRGEVRLWLDGLEAPEGRIGGEPRRLTLEMNAIALSAESPGPEMQTRDAWARLDEIGCLVLLVVGDLDMSHMQTRCRDVAARIPGARLQVMEGAAHLPALEQPEAVASIVRAFLMDLA